MTGGSCIEAKSKVFNELRNHLNFFQTELTMACCAGIWRTGPEEEPVCEAQPKPHTCLWKEVRAAFPSNLDGTSRPSSVWKTNDCWVSGIREAGAPTGPASRRTVCKRVCRAP